MERDYIDILHRCFRCGWCKFPSNYQDFNCPAYLKYRFESFSSGGRMWLIRAWINGDVEAGHRFSQILYSCVTCKNCVEACALPYIKDKLVDVFIAARKDMVEQGTIPPQVRDYFKAISTSGNPYRLPAEQRAAWAEGLDIEPYTDQRYLLYIGDVGSYDDLGKAMARSVAMLFKKAHISFGILGNEEISDGNDVAAAGEEGLATHLAEQNIKVFSDKGIRRIITLSPHSFHVMKTVYPLHGGRFQVYHYTKILRDLMGKDLAPGQLDTTVTYHDPCYLGRWNGEYYTPRAILNAIPGLRLVEFDRNMQNSLCCGGGGSNFFTDILGTGHDLASRVRIRDAASTGAQIVAVSCPQCYRMLDDALKAEGLEEVLQVREISEIVADSLTA
ncbi:MAG TPA: (Fe-S)-binding protein [Deltaproteobacteria bacterium]|nr:(Fe-S)-binding protein [Deltaproteobacteria bacterium]